MGLTWTQYTLLAHDVGIGGMHLADRVTGLANESRLHAVFAETKTNLDTVEARVTTVEATLAEAKAVANAAALKALDTSTFENGQLFSLDDTGALYRFHLGEAVGSEDQPETLDADDGGGVFHKAVAAGKYVHEPVDDVAAAKLLAGVDLVDGMSLLIKDCDGAGTRGTYIYRSAGAEVEALPYIIAVTAGGRLYDIMKYGAAMVAAEAATALVQTHLDQFAYRPALPTGPLADAGSNAISVDIDVKNVSNANVGASKRVRYWFSDDATGALTAAPPDQATTASAGAIIADDTVADGTGDALTDVTGNLTLTVGHVGGVVNWHLFVDVGGAIGSVQLQFTA